MEGHRKSVGEGSHHFGKANEEQPTATALVAKDIPRQKPASKSAVSAASNLNAPAPVSAVMQDDPRRRQKAAKTQPIARTPTQKQVDMFSHLSQYEREHSLTLNLRRGEIIHPEIVRLGLQLADHRILGSRDRCEAMLQAFKEVIISYRPPEDQTISRHLDSHLRPLITYLIQCRPLSVCMGHAIRQLKMRIAALPPDIGITEARAILIADIDAYIRDRFEMAGCMIAENGGRKIKDGDVFMTFARSRAVRDILIAAKTKGKSFRVIVVDSRPFFEGRRLLKELVAAGIECSYCGVAGIGCTIREVTKVLVGAACLFQNGSLLSRVGTAIVCAMGKRAGKPVIVAAETCKFSDRVQLDAFGFNELGDPDALVSGPCAPEPLADWRDLPSLKLLNILYDVTLPENISMIVTEMGLIPCSSVPVILREMNQLSQN